MTKEDQDQFRPSQSLVTIEIGNDTNREYLMNFDKVYHWDDIIVFLFLLLVFIVLLIGGYFGPSSTTETYTNHSISYTQLNQPAQFKISSDAQPYNKDLAIYIRFLHQPMNINLTNNYTVNISVIHGNVQSERTRTTEKHNNAQFISPVNSTFSSWHRIYFDKIVDFDSIKVDVLIYGDLKNYSLLQSKVIKGSEAGFQIQFGTRAIFTGLCLLVLKYFSEKTKERESRHEQLLTYCLLFGTAFYDNPSFIAHLYKPVIYYPIFDDILRSFYVGFITLYLLLLIGHFGNQEIFTESFISTRIYFSGVIGLLMLMRQFFNDLAQIYNPMLAINHADRYLLYAERVLYVGLYLFILVEYFKAWRRIEESDRFRFVIYLLVLPFFIYVTGVAMNLFGSYSTFMFAAEMGCANIPALALAYGHFPYSSKKSMEYNPPDGEIPDLEDNAIFEDENVAKNDEPAENA